MKKHELHLDGKRVVLEKLMALGVKCDAPKSRGPLLARNGEKTVRIAVSSTRTHRFMTGIYQRYQNEGELPDFWVFRELSDSESSPADRFYIVDRDKVVRIQKLRNKLTPESTFDEGREKSAGGVDNILPDSVARFENAWEHIVQSLQ